MTTSTTKKIYFSAHLSRFIDLPTQTDSGKSTLPDIINDLNERFPGIAGYLIHENGRLRQHVNVFLDGGVIVDREKLSDNLENVKEIFFMQALSGG